MGVPELLASWGPGPQGKTLYPPPQDNMGPSFQLFAKGGCIFGVGQNRHRVWDLMSAPELSCGTEPGTFISEPYSLDLKVGTLQTSKWGKLDGILE